MLKRFSFGKFSGFSIDFFFFEFISSLRKADFSIGRREKGQKSGLQDTFEPDVK